MEKRASTTEYWRLVQDCLVEFYGFGKSHAQSAVSVLRERLKKSGVKTRSYTAMVYHSDPLDVASDLAQEPLPPRDRLQTYYERVRMRQQSTFSGPDKKDTSTTLLQGELKKVVTSEKLLR